ncbi:NADH-quinone oxidoreductase subunit N [candidate division KSB1 bacterium]|nr:MAG: NADH-quinone oxidoreductase subunit N [candidate division KSB1 bacterium]
MNSVSNIDILGVLPETILVITALLVIVADAVRRRYDAKCLPIISVLGLIASAVAAMANWGDGGTVFNGTVFSDGFSSLFRVLFAVIGILTVLFSPHYMKISSMRLGEYYALILTGLFGMMVMAMAANLLLFFLGLETMSISLYVLAGSQRNDVKSAEAGMKYLVLGAFSSGFLLYGIALLYASVGSVDYEAIGAFFQSDFDPGPLLIAGIALLLVGFAFKVAAVPFHFWSPDVYDGAPATITGYMSTGPKAAAFVALIRVFGVALEPASSMWSVVITGLAILTMTVGNIVALRQTSVKRMLAYSSIAHAGYLLVGIVAGTKAAFAATAYYLSAYALMNLGAFAVLILLNRRQEGSYRFEDLRGMGFAHPLLGITLTIFLLSLTGVPPTAGFFGKLYVFSAAVGEGHIALAIVGLLNSAVAAYYYLRVITLLYMTKPETEPPIVQPIAYRAALVVSSILILLIGIFPEQLLNIITFSVP